MENTETVQKKSFDMRKLIGLCALVLCVVMLLVGFFGVKGTAINKIPIVSMVVPDDEFDTKEIKDEVQKELDKLEELVDESDLTSKQKNYVEDVIKSAKKFAKNLSVNSIKNLADAVADYNGVFDDELGEFSDAIKELETATKELKKVLNVIEQVFLWFMLIPMIFTVLGGLLRSKGWTIFAMITALPFFFLFGGVVWGIIAIVGYITQIVIYGKLKKAKKAAAAAMA